MTVYILDENLRADEWTVDGKRTRKLLSPDRLLAALNAEASVIRVGRNAHVALQASMHAVSVRRAA